MRLDEEFRKEAEEFLELTGAIKFYGDRQNIKKKINEIGDEIIAENPEYLKPQKSYSIFKKYGITAGIAASVMAVSIIGTLLITRSMETRQTAYYKELRRNVEQIKKSQKQIIDNIEDTKGNVPTPGKYSGTGFLISSNGYLATSYHVIKEADSIAIENALYGRLKASVVYSDTENDICILKINTPGFRIKKQLPFSISRDEADLGESVYTLGFPREEIVFGEGSISASTGYGQNPNAYQVSVPVNPGNSGGPLLNGNGDLIGMVSGVQTETAGAAFAIKSSRLLDAVKTEAVDTLSTPVLLPKQNSMRNLNRVQQIRKWKELVFMIRVYKGK
jgi:serine protease Do